MSYHGKDLFNIHTFLSNYTFIYKRFIIILFLLLIYFPQIMIGEQLTSERRKSKFNMVCPTGYYLGLVKLHGYI